MLAEDWLRNDPDGPEDGQEQGEAAQVQVHLLAPALEEGGLDGGGRKPQSPARQPCNITFMLCYSMCYNVICYTILYHIM